MLRLAFAAVLVALVAVPAAADPITPPWTVAGTLGFGWTDRVGSAPEPKFDAAGLSLGLRLSPRWELVGALHSGRQILDDGSRGARSLMLGAAMLRFHANPADAWEFELEAGPAALELASSNGLAPTIGGGVAFGMVIERHVGDVGIGLEDVVYAGSMPDAGATTARPLAATPTPTPTASDLRGGYAIASLFLAYRF
jgi:hypothetical protein